MGKLTGKRATSNCLVESNTDAMLYLNGALKATILQDTLQIFHTIDRNSPFDT